MSQIKKFEAKDGTSKHELTKEKSDELREKIKTATVDYLKAFLPDVSSGAIDEKSNEIKHFCTDTRIDYVRAAPAHAKSVHLKFWLWSEFDKFFEDNLPKASSPA